MSPGPGRDAARLRRDVAVEAGQLLAEGRSAAETIASGPDDAEPAVVASLFRAVHSLKGLGGLAGLPGLTRGAHALETVLDALRMGRIRHDAALDDLIGRSFSALESLVVAATRDESPEPPTPLLAALADAAKPTRPVEEAPLVELPEEVLRTLSAYETHRLNENVRRGRRTFLFDLSRPFATFEEDLRSAMAALNRVGELAGTFPGTASTPDHLAFRLLAALADGIDVAAIEAETGAAARALAPRPPPVRGTAAGAPAPEPDAGDALARLSLRVDAAKVDALLDAVAEVAVARDAVRDALGRLPAPARAARLETDDALARLDRAVQRVSRAVLSVRLVPVEQLGARLRRATTSLARELGKEAELIVVGGDAELDKRVLDDLVDPFLHLVRNALDHGIEPPDARLAAGKPRAGRITLSAASRGRTVELALADDGRGVDVDAVSRRAVETGLLAAGTAAVDPLAFLFRPGFTTARAVSEISGRGVGLDVVRERLGDLKGTVDVSTRAGAGTVFRVVVPATLALIETILVRTAGHAFALETSGVVRTLPAPGDGTTEGVPLGDPDGGPPIPVVRLARELGLPVDPLLAHDTIVVAELGDRRIGFRVAEVEGLRDLVVRPLPSELPRAAVITGAAELAGGELALVLDGRELVRRAIAREGSP